MLAALHNGNVHESSDSCHYDLSLEQSDSIPENLIQYCCDIADTILDECKNVSSDDLTEAEKNNCSDLKDAFIKPSGSVWQPLDKYPKDTCPVVDFRIMD
jgi:phage gp36-like protein